MLALVPLDPPMALTVVLSVPSVVMVPSTGVEPPSPLSTEALLDSVAYACTWRALNTAKQYSTRGVSDRGVSRRSGRGAYIHLHSIIVLLVIKHRNKSTYRQ